MGEITPRDTAFIHDAAAYLESPSYLMKVAEAIGAPLQHVADKVLPDQVTTIVKKALHGTMGLAAGTVQRTPPSSDFDRALSTANWTGRWHQLAATGAGAASGAFGFSGLAIELPLTTGIMFRSIAAIAHDFGEDLSTPEARLECVTVFSHGGRSPTDDAMDASYVTARIAMATLVRDAAEFVASKSAQAVGEALARGTAPALLTFVNRIAARFNIVVSQRLLAQGIPFLGIAAGAAINAAFAGHFNNVSRYHFGLRRLQRQLGTELVFDVYRRQLERIRAEAKKPQAVPGVVVA